MFNLAERSFNKLYQQEVENYAWDFIDKFKNKKILVTGASGLVGVALVDVLMIFKNVQIYAMCRNSVYAKKIFAKYICEDNFHLLVGEVEKYNFNEFDFDYIIHAASNADPRSISNDPVGVMKANIGGAVNLLEYMIKHNGCKMLYISSGEVYGEDIKNLNSFDENYYGFVDSKKPRSSYPESKRAAETFCISYQEQYGIDVIVGRLCHVYGPTMKQTDSRVIAEFIMDAVNDKPIILKSEGLQKRSLLYVFDAVSAFLFLLLNGKTGDVYNISNPNSIVRIREMAKVIAEKYSLNVSLKEVSLDDYKSYAGFDHAVLDNSKLACLGWTGKNSFEDGIVKTISILKNI